MPKWGKAALVASGHDNAWMATDAEKELSRAQDRLRRVGFGNRDALTAVMAAEQALAASRGESYAEAVDLGVVWDTGAPLPHVVSGSSRTVLLCRAAEPDADWDGTNVRSASPSDSDQAMFVEMTFDGCATTRFGSPNDEALNGHPLWGRGLEFCRGHVVLNSSWLEEHITINSVHEHHPQATWRCLTHFFICFHDETFEALARTVDTRLVRATMRRLLIDAVERVTAD
jgi:hypothetical protein